MTSGVRIDKWLWAVRIYKTRTLAADACRNGRVTINGQPLKPSREVRINELVVAQTGDLTRTTKVLGLLERRVGASAVKQFAEDLTPASEYEKKREPVLQPLFFRPKGAGRPTKKDRRDLKKLDEIL
ncbi:MAG TPA: RNA-binding S4 domain-containing protein [Verrucomicrobiae bacterium]|jgi:ribosome-associated heat shock protein Hsp15|nr:RNA-binding S4 domain-containing protein [Verrucomicrobiae bacterium]